MLLIISVLFIAISIMKLGGINIIHIIKGIRVERSENKIEYDKKISLSCALIGMSLLVFNLISGVFESEVMWFGLNLLLFISICFIIYAPIVYREGIVGNFLSRVEKSNQKRKVVWGCYILDVILISVLIVWKIFKNTDYGIPVEFYFLQIDTAIAIFISITLIIFSVLFVKGVTSYQKKAKIFITTAITLVVFGFSLFVCAWTTGGDYYSFYSPDLKQSVVIEEWTHLIAQDVRVYERKNIFFIKRIGRLPINSVNDFEHSSYDVEWKEETVVITLNSGEICEFVLKD